MVFGQSGENEKDSTYIFFKSGDSIKVNNLLANISFQNMINFDLEFSDSDSIKYDISEVNKIVEGQGRTLINKNTLFMIQFFRGCLNLFTKFYLLYLIIV